MTTHKHDSQAQEFSLAAFTPDGYDRGASYMKQILWMVASSTLITKWWLPNSWRISILRNFGSRIGANVIIRHNVRIHWPWKLEVGDNSWIGEQAWILNLEPVRIGHDTCISQGVMLCTGSHLRRTSNFAFDNAPITIGDVVWIATGSTILRGVHVGSNSTVGATCLITKDVPQNSVVLAPSSQT
ncbi:putative colanic acid biosynthesis acetyltransferase [Rhodococcus fascians]|nr:putative colanic acid biosynthesis acetyltransferase [Rhodococcus fascians]